MPNSQTSKTDAKRSTQVSLKNWGELSDIGPAQEIRKQVAVNCGWGRLIFGQTFDDAASLAAEVGKETPDQRDVAFYVREPHVVLACAPHSLFLDPSHTFRLDVRSSPIKIPTVEGLTVRPIVSSDETAVNRLYLAWSMVPIGENYFSTVTESESVRTLVVETSSPPNEIVGVVMGVDHRVAIADPDNGSSLWALAVDPQAQQPRIGELLITSLAAMFRDAGRDFMDLSVMHDNAEAIALYKKLGFYQIPVYSIKRKNPINEELFVGPADPIRLNIYAQIIVDEARRRGITVEIEDAEAGILNLSYGGRSISCRESLSDLTTAVAMSRCDDKTLTHRLLKNAGLRVPGQIVAETDEDVAAFMARHERIVVKPARGEQGAGVSVDLRSRAEIQQAIDRARELSESVILEEFVEGEDLRAIVIAGELVAAAIRRPPLVCGNGNHTVKELIKKLSRRRQNATGGESRVPLDQETERCVAAAGYDLSDVLPESETIEIRKTANLHTGGTIHDVTDDLHPTIREAAVCAAQTLEIPVVGLDLIVPDPTKPDYVIIEANERPGLANHEPQPTAARFVDLLFPRSIPEHHGIDNENACS